MTELVFVPRKLMGIWIRRGWGLVFPDQAESKNGWAVLMHPPGWPDEIQMKEKQQDG